MNFKRYFLGLILIINGFVLLPTTVIAQNRFVVNDTLQAHKLEDSAIVMFSNNDKMATIALLKQGLVFRKKINFAPKTAVNLWTTAFVHYDLKNYDVALYYLAQAKKYDATNHRIDNLCGHIHRTRGEYVLAKQAFLRSIQQAFANGNYDKAIEFHLEAVRVCTELNELDTAIIIAQKSIQLSKNPLSNAAMYTNVGNIYKDKNDLNKALAMYKIAITLSEQRREQLTNTDLINDNLQHQSGAWSNAGVVYRRQKNYTQALRYTKKCLAIRQKMRDTTALAESYGLMADIYTLQKKLHKSTRVL